MNNIVVASAKKSAGKTSIIVGLAKALKQKPGYMKPFGDRLIYRKKRLWDYDSALITEIFKLGENPEDITIGFEHSKLRYMYDEAGIKEKLGEISKRTSDKKDVLFIEGGYDFSYASSVNLDPIAVAKSLAGKLIYVISGNEGEISDDIHFIKKYLNLSGVKFSGVIINKVLDLEDFKNAGHTESLNKLGIPILGVIPYVKELSHLTAGLVAEQLFAKVIAGEGGMNNIIHNIFVGAMSADSAMSHPVFKKEDKLIITSGDRGDMIVTALENKAAAIVLTNNILPPSNLISKAAEKNVPMLLVNTDTYSIAKQIDNIEPLLTKDDTKRIDLLCDTVKKYVSLNKI